MGELIVDVTTNIILVAPEGREEEVVTRLSRVGFDKTMNLKGGMDAWVAAGKEIDTVKSVPATDMASNYEAFADRIFDVRKPGNTCLSMC